MFIMPLLLLVDNETKCSAFFNLVISIIAALIIFVQAKVQWKFHLRQNVTTSVYYLDLYKGALLVISRQLGYQLSGASHNHVYYMIQYLHVCTIKSKVKHSLAT